MSEDIPFFSERSITIVGSGLMGGSLALALKSKCKSLKVLDNDLQTIQLAKQMKLAETITSDPSEAFEGSGVIILATPVKTIIQFILDLPRLVQNEAIILDIGSTKGAIVEAMAGLPPRFDPIGGHPMCGKEMLTLSHADPSLFKGAPFAFVCLERTTPDATAFAEKLCKVIEAHPVWVDADNHDRWTAASSHLPFVVASALVEAFPPEARPLIGPGFTSATRLAATPSSMMLDIISTNRVNVIESIDRLQSNLEKYKELLEQERYVELDNLFSIISNMRESLLNPQDEENLK